MRAAVLVVTAWLLAGCAAGGGARASEEGRSSRRARLTVPFFPDETDQCGPSALASVLRFWGQDVSPADLKREIYRPALKGSLTVDLLLAAEDRGLSAEMAEGGWPRLRKELDAGHPLIAFVNRGFRFYPLGHYLVVTGYDDARGVVYAHSGMGRDLPITYERFDAQWEKTERWTLLILPPHA